MATINTIKDHEGEINKTSVPEPIYFNMNVPGWYKNASMEEKCSIIEDLAEELKDEEPLSQDQLIKEFISIK